MDILTRRWHAYAYNSLTCHCLYCVEVHLETPWSQNVEAILPVRKWRVLIIGAGSADYITIKSSIPIIGFLIMDCRRSTFSGSRKHLKLDDSDVGQLVPCSQVSTQEPQSARYYGTAALSIFKNEATIVHPDLFKKLEYDTKGGRWGTLGALATRQPAWLALARLLVPIYGLTSDFSNHFDSHNTVSFKATITVSDNWQKKIVCTKAIESLGGVDTLYLSHYMIRPFYPRVEEPRVPSEWCYSMSENTANVYHRLNILKCCRQNNKFNLRKSY
jgi:hypothetical protein